MAAFTLTASGVKVGTGAVVRTYTSAEAHNAGQAVTTTGVIVDINTTTKLDIAGIAVSATSASRQAVVVISGDIIVSDTLTPQRQIIAAPSGQLQYDDDLLSGDQYVIVGYTKDANTITLHAKNTGVAKA